MAYCESYRAYAKSRVISNNNVTVVKARGMCALADVNAFGGV